MSYNPDKPSELKNIFRIEIENTQNKSGTHGWQVRFLRSNNKNHISQLFSDNSYGGKQKALEAAATFRNAIEIEIEPISKEKQKKRKSLRNKSGIVGVNRTKQVDRRRSGKTYVYYYWQAHWPNGNNRTVCRKFSVSKYGEQGALKLAIEAREKGLADNCIENGLTQLFSPPQNLQIKIWRYMDFTKFVSMLENKGIFFPSLAMFDDPFEGSYSKGNKKLRPLINKHKNMDSNKISIGHLIQEIRNQIFANCWHMNEYESAGMWSLYSKTNESICLQSTYTILRECFGNEIPIGEVKYIDYEREWIPENNILAPFLYKRKSFKHEQEIRAIINLSGIDTIADGYLNKFNNNNLPKSGIWKHIDLNKLIVKINIAPYAPEWFSDLVKKVIKTYKIDKPVVKSTLEREPFF